MVSYDSAEKEIIALESDLLENPLTTEEKLKLSETDGDETINTRIFELLSQGVKLGRELEKLSQRGIKIIFSKNKRSRDIFSKFMGNPKILFVAGNVELLNQNMPKIVFSYSEFKQATMPVVFVSDRPMEKLLSYSDIVDSIITGKIIVVSDKYRGKSTLKTTFKQEKKEGRIIGKKVFISGSRTQEEIPQSVQESLEAIRKQKIGILIGDSDKGVDNEIIDYLRLAPKYPLVDVYTINPKPRIKIEPEWNTKIISVNQSLKPQQKQMVKDRAMADVADWGLAIFNPISKNRYGAIQVSSGTLRNTIQLLLNKKAVKFFFVINGTIESKNLKNIEQLKEIIELYKTEKLSESEKSIILTSRGINENENPTLVKYSKIAKKLDELLKVELKELQNNKQIKSKVENKVENKETVQLSFNLFSKKNNVG